MKKKIIKTIGAFTMASIIGFANNVYGAGGASPGASNTEVFAGIYTSKDRVVLDVIVPTVFAFVVNSDATNGAAAPGVATPNALVTGTTAAPTIGTVGSTDMFMRNRSTFQAGGTGNWVGTGVSIQGELKDEPGASFRYDSQLVTTGVTSTTRPAKTYGMKLIITPTTGTKTTHSFTTTIGTGTGPATELDTPIPLPAPTAAADGTINADTAIPLALVVAVGGTNADYSTPELSTRVGMITWKIRRTP